MTPYALPQEVRQFNTYFHCGKKHFSRWCPRHGDKRRNGTSATVSLELETRYCGHLAFLTSHCQIVTCFVLRIQAHEDAITPTDSALQKVVCQWLQVKDSMLQRVGRHVLFEGGKWLSTDMRATLKNNCAFSKVVLKYCELQVRQPCCVQ